MRAFCAHLGRVKLEAPDNIDCWMTEKPPVMPGARERLSAKDKALTAVLLEAPLLPRPAVPDFLADLASFGGEWATLALSSILSIATQRAPDRHMAAQVALHATTAAADDLRSKAVRLTANRLFLLPSLASLVSAVDYTAIVAHHGHPFWFGLPRK